MGKIKRTYAKSRRVLGQYASTTFLVFLLLSALLWYLTKLSYTYTTDVPIDVSIADNRFTVRCVAEGTGYRIFALRNLPNKPVKLSLEEVNASPSPTNPQTYIVDPLSLQNAISVSYSKIKIVSVEPLPEVKLKE